MPRKLREAARRKRVEGLGLMLPLALLALALMLTLTLPLSLRDLTGVPLLSSLSLTTTGSWRSEREATMATFAAAAAAAVACRKSVVLLRLQRLRS
jgi:hypothetical protein